MIHFVQDANFEPFIFSDELAASVSGIGTPADFIPLGCRWNRSSYRAAISLRGFQGVYTLLQTRFFARKTLCRVSPGDMVVVYESAPLASSLCDAGFQKAVLHKGGRYIPVFPDAWPISAPWLRNSCRLRVSMAIAIGCVTPALAELFRATFPEKNVLLFEEPVPTDRFTPDWTKKDIPTICWSGPPHKIDEVRWMIPVLESVARKAPFRLRIVSGSSRPSLETAIPIDWMPFDENEYQSRFAGVEIAFARYRDNPYGICKGNYKIKTYLAAGCAVVTSPVGYNLDLIRPGKTGLFAENRSEWEDSFLRLLQNPAERLAMCQAARAEAVARFSPEAIAKKFVGVLPRLA